MKERVLGFLLVALLALPTLVPIECVGPGCPCAPSAPAGPSSCCPEEKGCGACVLCADCAPRDLAGPVVAPASPRPPTDRTAPAVTIPAATVPIGDLAGGRPPGSGLPAPGGPPARHLPSIVLRV